MGVLGRGDGGRGRGRAGQGVECVCVNARLFIRPWYQHRLRRRTDNGCSAAVVGGRGGGSETGELEGWVRGKGRERERESW